MKVKITRYLIPLLFLTIIITFCSFSCSTPGPGDQTIEEPVVEEPEAKEEIKEESLVIETPEEESKKEFSPTIVGNISVYTGFVANVHVVEDYAYIAGGGLNIIDVTDKKNPIMVGMNRSMAWWRVGFYIDRNLAYLPYETCTDKGVFSGGGLQIIDISDKNSPTVVGTFESEGRIKDVWVIEDFAYATYEIKKQNGNEIIESGIKIIDVSDKENPIIAGVYETSNFSIGSIRIEGNYLYVLVEDNIEIIDITDRVNLVSKSSYPIYYKGGFSMSGTLDFFVDENYLYLPFDNSLQIIDVSDKENPIIAGDITAFGEVTDVFVEGDYAYITYVVRVDDWQVKESGMQIIDVKNKNAPAVVTGIEVQGEAVGIFIDGDYAYVGARETGLHIIKLFDE